MDLYCFQYFPTLKDFDINGQFANEQFDLENFPRMACSDKLFEACIKPCYRENENNIYCKKSYREILFGYILSLFGLQLRMTRQNQPSLQKCTRLTPNQNLLIDHFFVRQQQHKNKRGFVVLPFLA